MAFITLALVLIGSIDWQSLKDEISYRWQIINEAYEDGVWLHQPKYKGIFK
jgi:hypothetical protein